jgi:uncharacterized protein (DUF111 family)
MLPVPAPATLKLLEGHPVRPGPEGAGELVTPTGAALVKVLSSGPPPLQYVPQRSGLGAGTKELHGRANALRLIVADHASAANRGSADPADGRPRVEQIVVLAADVDDMAPEYVAYAAETLRAAGALDVIVLPAVMKKGRPGVRIEVLAQPHDADALERRLFEYTATLGVRRVAAERHALARRGQTVQVLGHDVRVKVAVRPDGSRHAKPEFEDIRRVAEATGLPALDILNLATQAAEHL